MNPDNIFQLDPPGTYELTLADGSKSTVTIVYDGDVIDLETPEQKQQRLNEERLEKLSLI
jgi:hypothetical protein